MTKKLIIHINDLKKEYNISLRELSRLTDIGHARLSELANGKKKRIQIDYIERIADALEINDISKIISLIEVEENN